MNIKNLPSAESMPTPQIDIVHLTFLPPHAPGSYNRDIGVLLQSLPEFRQKAISWKTSVPITAEFTETLIQVDEQNLTLRERFAVTLPERVRKPVYGVGGKNSLIYLWRAVAELQRLKPKLIVCYDNVSIGLLLRKHITWQCRLIFSQHGVSYRLPSQTAHQLYSLQSFDVIHSLTKVSYRENRAALSHFEATVAVIPNGVDVTHFAPASCEEKHRLRERWNIPAECNIVLFLSRLVPKKGVHQLLLSWEQILRSHPHSLLWIVGGGDAQYDAYLKNLAHSIGIADTVRFEGRIAPEETNLCYQTADVYAFPTLASEGMALSLMEAMACGLPCVVSDHATATEYYSNDEVVFVADPNLEHAFAEPIINLLADNSKRTQLSENARQLMETRFSKTLWLEAMRNLFTKQLKLV